MIYNKCNQNEDNLNSTIIEKLQTTFCNKILLFKAT
jgi:hypothetical protein